MRKFLGHPNDDFFEKKIFWGQSTHIKGSFSYYKFFCGKKFWRSNFTLKKCKKLLFFHFFDPLKFKGVKIWVLVVKNSKNLKWPAKITQIFRSFNINKIKILLSMKLKFHVEWAYSIKEINMLPNFGCKLIFLSRS